MRLTNIYFYNNNNEITARGDVFKSYFMFTFESGKMWKMWK